MKVISGGQTGVDRYALEIAREIGIPTGGTAPLNFYTDDGPDPSLQDFGVVEAAWFGYPFRTEENVKNSDATALFGDLTSPGCRLTIKLCKKHKKPCFENPTSDDLVAKILFYGVETLNVAGNREKNIPEKNREKIKETLKQAFIQWSEKK